MQLFARILSHGFALFVVAVLIVGLIYRGDLFPGQELPGFLSLERAADSAADDTSETVSRGAPASAALDAGNKEATGMVAGADTIGAADPVDVPAVEGVNSKDSVTDAVGTGTPEMVPPVATGAKTKPPLSAPGEKPSTSMPPADRETDAADAGGAGTSNTPAAETPLVSDSTEGKPESKTSKIVSADQPVTQAVVADDAAKATTESKQSVVADTSMATGADHDGTSRPAPDTSVATQAVNAKASTASPYQLLAAAREAYWLRDYATAEQHYQAMISSDPKNPDGYGELGNMYFSQGKWTLAAASYFEAGKRLADEGLHDQALQLVDVLKGLQGPQADELEQYIAARRAPQ